jgi:hypothetical protein
VEIVFPVVSVQIVWGALTGPFLMLLLVRGQQSIERARKSVPVHKDALRES